MIYDIYKFKTIEPAKFAVKVANIKTTNSQYVATTILPLNAFGTSPPPGKLFDRDQ